MRLPIDSLITSVVPSGVIAEPFGNISGSLATETVPSGSIRTSGVGLIGSPAIRSKPKFPA